MKNKVIVKKIKLTTVKTYLMKKSVNLMIIYKYNNKIVRIFILQV